jgi:hypothetical protein
MSRPKSVKRPAAKIEKDVDASPIRRLPTGFPPTMRAMGAPVGLD